MITTELSNSGEDSEKSGELEVSDETLKKISKQYRINEKFAFSIIKEYGTIENYIQHCIESRKYDFGTKEHLQKAKTYMKEDCKEKHGIIDAYGRENRGIVALLYDLMYRNNFIYDMDEVLEQLNGLKEKHKKVLIERYGITGTKRKTLKEIGEELGLTSSRIGEIIKLAHNQLRRKISAKKIKIINIPDFENLREEDKQIIIQALGNSFFYADPTYKDIPCNIANINYLVKIFKRIEKYGTINLVGKEMERVELEEEIEHLQKDKGIKQEKEDKGITAEEEYKKILEEEEQIKQGILNQSSTPKEEFEEIEEATLERLRHKRDKLLEREKLLDKKLEKAKELDSSYSRLNGNEQNNDNKISNLNDD